MRLHTASARCRLRLRPRRVEPVVRHPVSVLPWIAPHPAPHTGYGCGASMAPFVSRGEGWYAAPAPRRSAPDGRFFSSPRFGPLPRWQHLFRDADGVMPGFHRP